MKVFKLVLVIFSLLVVSCKPTKYTDLEDGIYADMITNKGTVLLKLEFEKTPITVANFVSLADGTNGQVADSIKGKHFYDGLVFHRVIKDFMCQGGDPLGTGSGDPGYKFIDEFPKDSLGNLLLKHDKAGVLSMANSGPTTNGSQFFITYKDTPWLDGKHTVFGNVVKGQSVVDSIAQYDTIKKVEIIKVGKLAKNFKADKVFNTYFSENKEKTRLKEEKLQIVFANKLKSFEENKVKATELPSGLKFVITETNNGETPVIGSKVKVNYAGYFTTGKLFDTSFKEVAKTYETYDERRDQQNGYAPFETIYGPEARLIPGFREGLQQMKIGDKAIIFIPFHLGYGAQGAGHVIPPNSDLVFELELVEVVK
tara:strand:- start:2843 stop:3949 length:1107 start_codon:yes stop_codon:yes gene_type:complete